METRATLLAKGLAKAGSWNTVVAVGDFGQAKVESREGVDLVIYRPILKAIQDNVVPRFGKYRWRVVVHLDIRDLHFLWQFPLYVLFQFLPKCLFKRFWHRLAPDVVCCFGNNPTSAEVIADCYRSGIKTVLCVASDDDLSVDYQPGDRRRNDYGTPRWMAWYAINTADFIMVQTEQQRDLLKRHFDRTGTLIKNPVAVADDEREYWMEREKRDFVLWVGKSDNFNKRPLLALDLAQACGEIEFVMIVNKTNPRVFETIQRQRPANVRIVEHVPHDEIWDYYRRARVFISTSAYEGFPNTFLQAAVYGVPVASLNVDPEHVLAGRSCGACADGDFERFVETVGTLWRDHTLAESYARRFYDHVRENHELDSQVRRFESFLAQVVAAPDLDIAPSCWRLPFSRFAERTVQRSG